MNCIAVHPTNPDVVLVGTEGGLHRIDNGGRISWDFDVYNQRTKEVCWIGETQNDWHMKNCRTSFGPRRPRDAPATLTTR